MKLIIPLILVSLAVIHARPDLEDGDLADGYGDADSPRVEASSHKHEAGKEFGRHKHKKESSGLHGKEHHNKGTEEHHNIGQHHRKTSTVAVAESSESHNVGSSVTYDKGGSAGGAFNNEDNNNNEFGKEFETAQDGSIIA